MQIQGTNILRYRSLDEEAPIVALAERTRPLTAETVLAGAIVAVRAPARNEASKLREQMRANYQSARPSAGGSVL